MAIRQNLSGGGLAAGETISRREILAPEVRAATLPRRQSCYEFTAVTRSHRKLLHKTLSRGMSFYISLEQADGVHIQDDSPPERRMICRVSDSRNVQTSAATSQPSTWVDNSRDIHSICT
jgi:hypothetical protein